jgi:peptidoglycan/LPS O-acetylase OafA/YrhL
MRSQINSLTATRFVAALMVFIHHFGTKVFPFNQFVYFFDSGNLAVSYFFVLSGFVLYISYDQSNISYADYFKRRVGRIVPVYLLALVLFIIVAFCFYDYKFSNNLVRQIIYCALFLQAYFPQYALSLNSPAWTISVEMLFYILFPLFLFIEKRNTKFFVTITILLFIVSQFIHLRYYQGGIKLSEKVEGYTFYHPFIHMSQFLLGMIGGYLYKKMKNSDRKYKLLPILLFCAIVLLIAFRPVYISYHVGLLAPLFMLFILSVAINDPKLLNIKGLVFLGEISYGIYILQFPVYKFFDAVNTKYTHMPAQYFFYFSLTMLLLCAAISYTFFEKPLRRKINSISFKRLAV